jgi:hypothetical protein
MYIELKNDRVCGSKKLIKGINIRVLDQIFLINVLGIAQEIEAVLPEGVTTMDKLIPPPSILPISETVSIDYQNIKNLSEDFGIIGIAFNYNFNEYEVMPITPNTFMGKVTVGDFYARKNLIPMILIFTPYKDCEFSECNVLIRKLKNIEVSTNVVFHKTISTISEFMAFDFPWEEQNYPKIISPSEAKIGEKINLEVISPNNRPVYLETNIGTLNKTKVTSDTKIELDLSNVQDIDEDVEIKLSYKYWSGITGKKIKLS